MQYIKAAVGIVIGLSISLGMLHIGAGLIVQAIREFMELDDVSKKPDLHAKEKRNDGEHNNKQDTDVFRPYLWS